MELEKTAERLKRCKKSCRHAFQDVMQIHGVVLEAQGMVVGSPIMRGRIKHTSCYNIRSPIGLSNRETLISDQSLLATTLRYQSTILSTKCVQHAFNTG